MKEDCDCVELVADPLMGLPAPAWSECKEFAGDLVAAGIVGEDFRFIVAMQYQGCLMQGVSWWDRHGKPSGDQLMDALDSLLDDEQVAEGLAADLRLSELQAGIGRPAAEQPAAEQPAVEQPAVEQPAAEQPAVEQPAVEQPAAEQPAVEQPAAEQPAVEQPAVEQPAVEQPAAEQPAAEQPAAEQPAAEPVAAEPVAAEPVAAEPVAGQVGADSAEVPELSTGVQSEPSPDRLTTVAEREQLLVETRPFVSAGDAAIIAGYVKQMKLTAWEQMTYGQWVAQRERMAAMKAKAAG